MEQFNEFLNNLTSLEILDIVIAVGIIVFFRILSSTMAYAIIRIFTLKSKRAKDIKQSAFYSPLKVFFIILGVYLAVLFLKRPLNLSSQIMHYVTVGFEILSVIAFAIGLAKSFTTKSSLIHKMRKQSKKEIDDTTLEFILKIVRAVIYIITVFIVLALLKIDLTGLIAGLGIGGLILTLAAQDTAKNLFGGLVIFLDKPFNVGDWIQMDSYEGTIEDITFRTTRIRTFENSILNVPNSKIADSAVINWSKMEQRRYKINLRIELGTPVEKLQKLQQRVEKMLHDRESILDDSTIVRFDNMTEEGINMLIYTYTDSVGYDSYLEECEDINYKLMKILEEENIKVAYDTQNIYVRN